MAFFDEMDRKLSQFGQSVSNKSREVSEGMRLSSAIKAEEEKQNNLYREVGKYYFENCAVNAEGQLKVLCDQIVASMELTSQYKQQQNVLKGMVSCPNCGAQISANSGFCNVCGSKIEKQVSPAPQPGAGKICPKCQKTVEADALFCTFCGNQFEKTSLENRGSVPRRCGSLKCYRCLRICKNFRKERDRGQGADPGCRR